MTKKPTGLEEWMRDRERHPTDPRASDKALAEWMAYQKRLEQMTPVERKEHERELSRRKRKRDDEGYGLENTYIPDGAPEGRDEDDS